MSKKRLVFNIVLIVLMLAVSGFVLKLCLDQMAPGSDWLKAVVTALVEKNEPERESDTVEEVPAPATC